MSLEPSTDYRCNHRLSKIGGSHAFAGGGVESIRPLRMFQMRPYGSGLSTMPKTTGFKPRAKLLCPQARRHDPSRKHVQHTHASNLMITLKSPSCAGLLKSASTENVPFSFLPRTTTYEKLLPKKLVSVHAFMGRSGDRASECRDHSPSIVALLRNIMTRTPDPFAIAGILL